MNVRNQCELLLSFLSHRHHISLPLLKFASDMVDLKLSYIALLLSAFIVIHLKG